MDFQDKMAYSHTHKKKLKTTGSRQGKILMLKNNKNGNCKAGSLPTHATRYAFIKVYSLRLV